VDIDDVAGNIYQQMLLASPIRCSLTRETRIIGDINDVAGNICQQTLLASSM
jgi:hypothetical protein